MINFTGDVSLTDGYFNVGFGVGNEIMKEKILLMVYRKTKRYMDRQF